MEAQDAERLSEPFSDALQRSRGLERALGVDVPFVHELEKSIRSDLDPQVGGIGWWKGHLDVRSSCQIGFYLSSLPYSVHYNLLQAGIHVLELREWEKKEAQQNERSVMQRRDGKILVASPPAMSPTDSLPAPMVDLHTAGFFRAVCSALDCMGSTVVGVVGLPVGLLLCGWSGALTALNAFTPPSPEANKAIRDFRIGFDQISDGSGPVGWREWALSYRNMLVHRALRLEPRQAIPRPTILGPYGYPIYKTEVVRHMLKHPRWSEVDAWRDAESDAVLTEDARKTIEGILGSAVTFLDGVARYLLELWETRRKDPSLIKQPAKQWPKADLPNPGAFGGYAPGSLPYEAHAYIARPSVVDALRSSHVLDDRRKERWGTRSDGTPGSAPKPSS